MPIISKIALRLSVADTWESFWSSQDRNLHVAESTRNGLVLPDSLNPGTNDVTIKLPYLNKPAGNEYYYVADNGALDIGTQDITLAGWVYTADKAAEYNLIGKLIAGGVNGRYGIAQAITTGYLYGMIQSSGGTYYCGGTVDGTTGWHFVLMEIDQTAKKIRMFVDDVQSGADVDFTGTFNALGAAYEFHIGTGNNSSGTSKSGTAKSSHSDTYLYTKLLTPTEKTTLYGRGSVSGAKAHWPLFNTEGSREYDVSGNGYHLTGVNITSAEYLYGDHGSRHGLDVGFTHYQNGYGNIYIGLKADGTEITATGIDPGYKKTFEGSHSGDANNYNLANAKLLIPGDSWDRSDTTIFNEAARRVYTYYDAANPNEWHPTELNNLLMQSWCNDNYKGLNFVKVSDYSYKSRKTLKELFSFSTNKSGSAYSKIVSAYCRDYAFAGIYENDYIFWKPENHGANSILAVEGEKIIRWENAATDKLSLSVDSGAAYPYSINSPKNGLVPTFAHIFQNGNILVGFEQNIYLSTDNLASLNEITVKALGGSDYVPTNNSYFYFVNRPNIIVDGVEMFIFGTYDTAAETAHVNIDIFYTIDNGVNIKSCYKAGTTNPPNLGARHIHSINYREADGSFWVCTGDNEGAYTGESNILRGVYDWDLDSWSWEKLYGDLDAGCTYKLISMEFLDDSNILAGDDNTLSSIRNGLWTCPVADLDDSANFVSVFKTVLGGGMITYLEGADLLAALADAINTDVLITSKTGTTGLVGHKLYGLPADIIALVPNKKRADGWRLVICGMNGVALGDGLSSPNVVWIKQKY